MGIIDKFKKAIQPDPDDNDFDNTPDELSYDYDEDPIINNNSNIYNNNDFNNNFSGDITSKNSSSNVSIGGNEQNHDSVELKIAKPKDFKSEVGGIADQLLEKKTIILNLEETNKETARRLIDFLSGVAYAIDGKVKNVGNNTIIITPNGVGISGDQVKNEKLRNNSDDIYD